MKEVRQELQGNSNARGQGDILKLDVPWHRKGLWNIDKKKKRKPVRQVTWAERHKGDDHFSRSWLREDAGETAGEVEGKKRRTKGDRILRVGEGEVEGGGERIAEDRKRVCLDSRSSLDGNHGDDVE